MNVSFARSSYSVMYVKLKKHRGATSVRTLNISSCNVETLPKILLRFKFLTKLVVNYNFLTELPLWLSQLKRLKEIECAGNRLSEFPVVVNYMPWLRSIYLDQNKILALPYWIYNVPKLQLISCNDCPHLTQLPRSILNSDVIRCSFVNTGLPNSPQMKQKDGSKYGRPWSRYHLRKCCALLSKSGDLLEAPTGADWSPANHVFFSGVTRAEVRLFLLVSLQYILPSDIRKMICGWIALK